VPRRLSGDALPRLRSRRPARAGDRVYVVDVNPNPDIYSQSLLVIAADMVGLSYDEVIARITEFAVERWRSTQAEAVVKRSRKRGQPEIVSKPL
jgi:GTP:adenosylcobinamide-phosphate guanylyltransferase